MNDVHLSISDFKGRQDMAKVKAFLLGRERWRTLPDYWTTGKSTVGAFQAIFDSPSSHHRFWQDGKGKYHAYLWLHPEASDTVDANANSWRVMAHPPFRSEEVVGNAIDHAENQLLKLADQSSKPVETVCYGEDHWLASLLHERGYIKQEALEVYMQRSLDGPVETPQLPDGYTIRPLDQRRDITQRAGAQSDAFAGEAEPGEWALENTHRFLRWYEARNDLDLVAVTATGEIASFAVFLIDPVTRVGELDPVGTRNAHQRKGLSKAVLLAGLQYMKSAHMDHAAVRTGVENAPAIHTYASVGFRVVDYLYRYTRE